MRISIDGVEFDIDTNMYNSITQIANIEVTPFDLSIWPEDFILVGTDVYFDHPVCEFYSCSFIFKDTNEGPEFHQLHDNIHYFLLNRSKKFKIKI